jgi:hypothetical protein
MGKKTDAGERMLAAREEMIDRILKIAEMHDLDDAQMVAASIHAAAGWPAPAIH